MKQHQKLKVNNDYSSSPKKAASKTTLSSSNQNILNSLNISSKKENFEIFMVTPDKDFAQLQTMKNINQYSPIKKGFIKESNPRKQLWELVLKGDTSDGVPNVLSGDQVFVEGVRQTPLRQKAIDQLMEDPKSMGDEVFRNYQRNRKLIDLSDIRINLKGKK